MQYQIYSLVARYAFLSQKNYLEVVFVVIAIVFIGVALHFHSVWT